MPLLPDDLLPLVSALHASKGVTAVVLGGSRALGVSDERSDWDLGVYYRGTLDSTALEAWGAVHPPGSWGRIMNGGAWLKIGERKVDVLFRDADVVARWSEAAERGEFEIDLLLGYVAGIPTYSLAAESTLCVPIVGLPPPKLAFPERLATEAEWRWRFCRRFSLEHARMHARRGDAVATAAHLSRGVLEEAHARVCAMRTWVLNEKRLLSKAGLDRVQASFLSTPAESEQLPAWVERVSSILDANG